MVTPAGLEPATYPLGGDCSIQLSHGAGPVEVPADIPVLQTCLPTVIPK